MRYLKNNGWNAKDLAPVKMSIFGIFGHGCGHLYLVLKKDAMSGVPRLL